MTKRMAGPCLLVGFVAGLLLVACAANGSDQVSESPVTTGATSTTTSTTGAPTTSSTTTSTSTSTTVAPLGTVDPPIEAGVPEGAPDVAVMVEQDQFGVIGPAEQVWWWNAFEQDEPLYLGGHDTMTTAPDGSIWTTRSRLQTEPCTPIVMDVTNFTGPGRPAVSFNLTSVSLPNCRPEEVRWPAGYLDAVAASEFGLVLLRQDQFPRHNCDLVDCIPDKVVWAELRPYNALDEVGRQVQIYRKPLNIEGRDPSTQAVIPFPGAFITGESLDGSVISLRFDDDTGALLDLATLDLSAAANWAIPTADGVGHLYVRVEGDFPAFSSTLIEARPDAAERPLFTLNAKGIIPFADGGDYVVVGIVVDEQVELMLYDREAAKLHFTGIQGLPGPQLARVLPSNG